MKIVIYPLLLGLLLCIPFYFSSYYFFPGDILNTIPSFSESGWDRPENSLLADPVFQFEPWRDFAKSEIRSGRFPLWNNLNGGGTPFFANFQSAVLFPINVIYYLLPERIALALIALSKLSLFFTGVYLYLRVINIKPAIAIIGAFATTFSGFMILWLQWPHTNVYLLFPLLLFVTEKIRANSTIRYRWYAALAVVYFFAVTGGHPETLFHITLIHGAYTFFRLWSTKTLIVPICISVVVGYLLGSVQIIPFLEYLFYSHALFTRSTELQEYYLPVVSYILNFFPMLLGAPHLDFYRPITQETNFQESVGGYTGTLVILSTVFGFFYMRKVRIAQFWLGVVLVCWLLSYKIWPFWYLNTLPFFSISANHRLIAFSGFGAVILFSLSLNAILQGKPDFKIKSKKFGSRSLAVLFMVFLGGLFISSLILPSYFGRHADFVPQLLSHIGIIVGSTLVFFWGLVLYGQKRIAENIFIFVVFFVVFLQTFFLFWNYNPLIKESSFYPQTSLTKFLSSQPKGAVLEVGNPVLPADVNLKYQVPQVLSNDAVEVRWYNDAYNRTFPVKNHWKLPDEVSVDQARAIGASYILSDYDLRLKRYVVQPDVTSVMPPLLASRSYVLSFKAEEGRVRTIRLRGATFNRNNTCTIRVLLRNLTDRRLIVDGNLPCSSVRNNMYFSLDFPPVLVNEGRVYRLEITSDTEDEGNAIALYGSGNSPYLELLYEKESEEEAFRLLAQTESTYIWKVPDGGTAGEGLYSVVTENPQQIRIHAVASEAGSLIIKKTYYPGWQARVNGEKRTITNADPFIRLPIDKGENEIVLMYRPLSFAIGLLLSFVTGVGVLVYQVVNELRRR